MGVLATLYIECFNRLWGFWRRFIQSALLGYRGFWRRFIQGVLIGYGGFGDALYRVFYIGLYLYRVFYQVIGVLATLYIDCFNRLLGFWRRFTQCFNRLWGFGNALYGVFSQVMGILATLYIECFIRLWGFWRRFINSVLSGYGGFVDAL